MMLTTHLNLAPRLRLVGAMLLPKLTTPQCNEKFVRKMN
jgi:hypothetical protein